MTMLNDIRSVFLAWIAAAVVAVRGPLERLNRARRIRVVEDEDGWFIMRVAAGKGSEALQEHRIQIADGTIQAASPEWNAALRGSEVELVLQPSRFLFRALDLPNRASEFLDGIVRAQIDRLTPWSTADAAYHWTPPCRILGDRIAMTVVATARNAVSVLADAFSNAGAVAVQVSTIAPGSEAARVTVFNQRAGGKAPFAGIRTGFIVLFAVTGILAALSSGAGSVLADHYDGVNQQLKRQLSDRRAMLRRGHPEGGNTAVELLERRKQTTPSSVMVIEALSAILPDHTYATEVRIVGEKLQVIGISRDAPSLIQILEQSPHFGRAAFFAPTTRASNEPGERFHIEARIRPHFGGGT